MKRNGNLLAYFTKQDPAGTNKRRAVDTAKPVHETGVPLTPHAPVARLHGSDSAASGRSSATPGPPCSAAPSTQPAAATPTWWVQPSKKERVDSAGPTPQDADRGAALQQKLQEDAVSAKGMREVETRFAWLRPDACKDASGRSSQHPEYDVRTVQVPRDVHAKMSASQRQYWDVKAKYRDVVLFFKVGTFYELYEDDAQLVHDLLDWKLTITGVGKCRQVGCPQTGLREAMRAIAAAGHKVGVMEQLQPKAREAPGGSKKKDIIPRELVHVLTPATDVDHLGSDAAYVMAVCQHSRGGGTAPSLGFVFLDAATARVFVGVRDEDDNASSLRTLLRHVGPVEVLHAKGNLGLAALRCLRDPLYPVTVTQIASPAEFPTPESAGDVLESCFASAEVAAQGRVTAPHSAPEARAALAALYVHLKRIKCLDDLAPTLQVEDYGGFRGCMRIDGASVANLELLSTTEGSFGGSVWHALDTCHSAAGHRLLRSWLCQPLQNIPQIEARQDAVEAILANPEALAPVLDALKQCKDLERTVGRCRSIVKEPCEALPSAIRAAAQQKRLAVLSAAATAIQVCVKALEAAAAETSLTAGSALLRRLLGSHSLASGTEAGEVLAILVSSLEMRSAAAAGKSKKSGERVAALRAERFEELTQLQGDDLLQKEISLTTELVTAFNEHQAWSDIAKALATLDVLAAFAYFATSSACATCRPRLVPAASGAAGGAVFEARDLWHPCLVASAIAQPIPTSLNLGSPSLPCVAPAAASPLEPAATPPAHGAAHPVGQRTLLLTGPNMGGKSTLLRTVCVASILAQIGCHAPAAALTLSPIDAIFTRIGATDRIMSGESTFMVECSECATIMRDATRDSLVVFDELGRGTSTFDGYAIAHAVLGQLAEHTDCRTLFATHYHPLTAEFAGHPRVALGHMAARVDCESAAASSQIAFLYQLHPGASPRSYGLHVAALAGIPEAIREVAARMGAALESTLSKCFAPPGEGGQIAERSQALASPAVTLSPMDGVDMENVVPGVADLVRVLASIDASQATGCKALRSAWQAVQVA